MALCSSEVVQELEELSHIHYIAGFKKASFFINHLRHLLRKVPPHLRKSIIRELLLTGKWAGELATVSGYKLEAEKLVQEIKNILNSLPENVRPYFQDIYNKLAVLEGEIYKHPNDIINKLENLLKELKEEVEEKLGQQLQKLKKQEQENVKIKLKPTQMTAYEDEGIVEVGIPHSVPTLSKEVYEKLLQFPRVAAQLIFNYNNTWNYETTIAELFNKALREVGLNNFKAIIIHGFKYAGVVRPFSASGKYGYDNSGIAILMYSNGKWIPIVVFFTYHPTKSVTCSGLGFFYKLLTKNIEKIVPQQNVSEEAKIENLRKNMNTWFNTFQRRLLRLARRYIAPVLKRIRIEWNLI